MPKSISIILPIYNMARYLPAALNSVMSQTLQDIEIICVNDCSTDESPKILDDCAAKDDRIKIVMMPENLGAGPSRNAGMRAATGDYIAFLDPDDLLASDDVLKKLYDTAIKNDADIVGGNLHEFYGHDMCDAKDWGKATFTKNRFYTYEEYPFSVGFYRFIYKRDMIVKNDFFFPPLRRYQDPVWFVAVMVKTGKFYGMDIPVYLYRKSHQTIAMTTDKFDHVLTGMAKNLDIFCEKKLQKHFAREQKELDYCLYRAFYNALKNPWSEMPYLWNVYQKHKEKSSDIQLKPRHAYGVLRYGITLIKKKFLYQNHQNSKSEKTRFIAITKSSGGTKSTSTAIATAWASVGYDVHLTAFLPGKMESIRNVTTEAIFGDKSYARPITVLLCFCNMVKWMIVARPQNILVIGLPLSVPLIMISKMMFWQEHNIAVLIDTHISGNLAYKKLQKTSVTFKVMSNVTHAKFFYKFVTRHATKIISLTDKIAQDMMDNYGLSKNKSTVIPPVIRNEFFASDVSAHRPDNSILFIGRLSPEKNLDDLMNVFSKLVIKNNGLKLIIVGDGSERGRLEAIAKTMGFNGQIEFAGMEFNTIPYLKSAGCLVLCSHYEGFPLVFIESLAMGVPVVTYNFPAGPQAIIIEGKNGFVVPQYDGDALGVAIEKALNLKVSPHDIRESVMDFYPDIARQKFIEIAATF